MSKGSQQGLGPKRGSFSSGRDVFLYLAIAVGIYAALAIFVFYQVRTHQPPGLPLKWLGFAAMTALVFGDTIRINRRWWGPRFWLLLGALFGAQCGLGVAILWRVTTKFSTLVWGFLIPLDYIALGACLGFFLEGGGAEMFRSRKGHHQRSKRETNG